MKLVGAVVLLLVASCVSAKQHLKKSRSSHASAVLAHLSVPAGCDGVAIKPACVPATSVECLTALGSAVDAALFVDGAVTDSEGWKANIGSGAKPRFMFSVPSATGALGLRDFSVDVSAALPPRDASKWDGRKQLEGLFACPLPTANMLNLLDKAVACNMMNAGILAASFDVTRLDHMGGLGPEFESMFAPKTASTPNFALGVGSFYTTYRPTSASPVFIRPFDRYRTAGAGCIETSDWLLQNVVPSASLLGVTNLADASPTGGSKFYAAVLASIKTEEQSGQENLAAYLQLLQGIIDAEKLKLANAKDALSKYDGQCAACDATKSLDDINYQKKKAGEVITDAVETPAQRLEAKKAAKVIAEAALAKTIADVKTYKDCGTEAQASIKLSVDYPVEYITAKGKKTTAQECVATPDAKFCKKLATAQASFVYSKCRDLLQVAMSSKNAKQATFNNLNTAVSELTKIVAATNTPALTPLESMRMKNDERYENCMSVVLLTTTVSDALACGNGVLASEGRIQQLSVKIVNLEAELAATRANGAVNMNGDGNAVARNEWMKVVSEFSAKGVAAQASACVALGTLITDQFKPLLKGLAEPASLNGVPSAWPSVGWTVIDVWTLRQSAAFWAVVASCPVQAKDLIPLLKTPSLVSLRVQTAVFGGDAVYAKLVLRAAFELEADAAKRATCPAGKVFPADYGCTGVVDGTAPVACTICA